MLVQKEGQVVSSVLATNNDNLVKDYPCKRLRILWLSHVVPYPPKGGVLMRSYHLLRQVARYHQVDLWSFNQSRLLSEYFPTLEQGIAEARAHFSSFTGRVHIEAIPSERHRFGQHQLALRSLFTTTPYTINWLASVGAIESLRRWLADGRYDLVHFDTESLAPYRRLIGNLPSVMDHHNAESHMLLRRATQQKNLARKFYFWQEGVRLERYERATLGRFDHHIVCSNDDRKRLLAIDRSLNVSVVPNGVAVAAHKPPRSEGSTQRLLFIGGLDWYPNRDAVDYFLSSVWPLVKKRCPMASIDIIGKRPSDSLIAAAAADTTIRVHGFVDDISEYYRDAAVYVCPIRDGGGTKLKILDALAHRVPLVAQTIACEGIDVTDGEHLLMAESAEGMAQHVVDLLADPARAQQLGNAGYWLMKERYDFERIGYDLASLYSSLAAAQASA